MEPFVFAFSKGEDDAPRVMFIADVRCACGLCGHPQLQRFYHSAPFHSLTASALARLARGVNARAGYSCPNCGTPVGPGEVVQGAITYGFPDDAGTLFATIDYTSGGAPVWELTPSRRLDPQAQPRFEPDEGVETFGVLTERTVAQVLDRVVSPKALWRDLFLSLDADSEGGAWEWAAPGYLLVADVNQDGLEATLDELLYDDDRADLVSVPLGIDAARRVGDRSGWLPEGTLAALERGELVAEALVSESLIVEAVRRAFEVGRLKWREVERDEVVVFTDIETPRGQSAGSEIDTGALAEHAALTGITPGEAGRLAAEELIGTLLRVW